eukprot:10134901-Lingulodinium_polyedra.AAC.1
MYLLHVNERRAPARPPDFTVAARARRPGSRRGAMPRGNPTKKGQSGGRPSGPAPLQGVEGGRNY